MTFNDTISFCDELNLYFQIPGMKFDLPTKKEWLAAKPLEYEGIVLEKNEDLQKVAWCYQNSNNSIHPVGQKQSNINGLYDLLGNVWEWTKKDYEAEGKKMIVGGSYYNLASSMNDLNWICVKLTYSSCSIGFRVVLRPIKY